MAAIHDPRPATDASEGNAKAEAPPTAEADQFDYLADMVGELRTMARRLGAETLADILALAHAEAARAAVRRRSPAR